MTGAPSDLLQGERVLRLTLPPQQSSVQVAAHVLAAGGAEGVVQLFRETSRSLRSVLSLRHFARPICSFAEYHCSFRCLKVCRCSSWGFTTSEDSAHGW